MIQLQTGKIRCMSRKNKITKMSKKIKISGKIEKSMKMKIIQNMKYEKENIIL